MEERRCPYCAEEIAPQAVRCPHCRSRLSLVDPLGWYRGQPARKVGGVAVALARSLALPLAAVRAAFLLATFFNFLGPIVYVALWLTIPFRLDDQSLLDRGLAEARAIATRQWKDWLRAAPDAAGRRGPMS